MFEGIAIFEEKSYVKYFNELAKSIKTYISKGKEGTRNVFTFIKDNIKNFGVPSKEEEVKVKLPDENGNLITEPHVPGELIYRGKNVALGYAAGGEDLIRGDDWHGELHTGDLAETDEDGFLYITGRLKRFIKISGSRISLNRHEDHE